MSATNSPSSPTTRRIGAMKLTIKSDLEVELERVFEAPRRLVFEAYSRCEHVKRWWGRHDTRMVGCEMDFRTGGTWRFVLRKDSGHEFAFRGEYREIVAPERLVQTFEFEGMPGTIVEDHRFVERDGKTTLTVTSRFDSIEARDGLLSSGMETGAAETWNRLAEHLKTMA